VTLVALIAASLAGPAAAQPAPAEAPAAEAPYAPAERVERFQRDVFYVVDAWVVRRDGWVVARDPSGLPDAERDEQFAVVWDERPRLESDGVKIVGEEWVVVDGTGRMLTVGQFGVLSGELAGSRPRSGKTFLGGVQRFYDRDHVEELAADRAAWAAARAGLPPEAIVDVRERVVASLPQTAWSPVAPAALD
jgi:hypothetical protein